MEIVHVLSAYPNDQVDFVPWAADDKILAAQAVMLSRGNESCLYLPLQLVGGRAGMATKGEEKELFIEAVEKNLCSFLNVQKN